MCQHYKLSEPSLSGKKKWEVLALKNNWKIVSLQHNKRVLKGEIKRLKSGHLPTVDLVARYAKMTSGGGNFGQSNTESKTIALQFNLPIYQGGLTNSRVKEAVLK